jgi:DNA polymerase type B, organellar and viral
LADSSLAAEPPVVLDIHGLKVESKKRAKRSHNLARVRRKAYPRRFIFWDSESRVADFNRHRTEIVEKSHTPRLIVAECWEADATYHYQERETLAFKGQSKRLCDDFWQWVAAQADTRGGGHRGSVVVIAHNIGYDVLATGGADRLHALGWESEAPYEKGPIFIWRFNKNGRTVTLLSSTNFYLAKLEKIGKDFGLPKLDTDTQTENEAELETYCRRDCAIVRTAILGMVDFLRDNDIGPWADTISSVAFKALRYVRNDGNCFLRSEVEIHTDPVATKIERDSYCGGRTEPQLVGVPAPLPVYDVDYNSLYPWVMLDNLFPIRLLQIHDGDKTALLTTLETGGLVIADVTLKTEVPCVPFKDPELRKLLFPVGTFNATLCAPELRLLLAHGGEIVEVRRWAVYEGAPIFHHYVSDLYARRVQANAEGKDAWVQLFKNLLNNLYGKFGQKSEEWVCVGNAPPELSTITEYVGPDGTAMTERIFGGKRWVVAGATEAYNSFPAIASFVTSYARVALWGAMNVAGNWSPDLNGGHGPAGREFYYCDTDSLFVSEVGFRRLTQADMIDAAKLGKLKLEKTLTQKAIFYAPKTYEIDSAFKRKGVPARAVERWTNGSPVLTQDGQRGAVYDGFPKLATALRRWGLGEFRNLRVVKKLDATFDKANVWEDGWTTPLRLPREIVIEEGTK